MSVDPELDRLFPEKTATRVTIDTHRGTFTTTVEYPRGDPENPLSDVEIAEKFLWLTVGVTGDERSKALEAMVERLEQIDDMKHLAELVAY